MTDSEAIDIAAVGVTMHGDNISASGSYLKPLPSSKHQRVPSADKHFAVQDGGNAMNGHNTYSVVNGSSAHSVASGGQGSMNGASDTSGLAISVSMANGHGNGLNQGSPNTMLTPKINFHLQSDDPASPKSA